MILINDDIFSKVAAHNWRKLKYKCLNQKQNSMKWQSETPIESNFLSSAHNGGEQLLLSENRNKDFLHFLHCPHNFLKIK